ncbi:MAG: 23S rRNA (uracil(1939)-C(5))-methyltransferase RlmD [Gammaproteobacteria bacterium]|nr:MAG: 23S rRNA (uracil(1939)-C(5))-methyltransferase RlmD [Gammaproteobacteria bacterium]
MGRRRRRQRLPQEPVEASIDSLSHDGRGVARVDEKVTFIHGALPGERVRFRYTARRRSRDEGEVVEVLEPSPRRVEPGCEHFGLCGGCSLQHLEAQAQIEYKQQILLDAFTHLGKVDPEEVLPPLLNERPWGYRRKARLGVKNVPKKGRVLVGFRERGSNLIATLEHCEVLHPKIGHALMDLSDLIGGLSRPGRIPQIEVAMDDERCVLIFRNLDPLGAEDEKRLRDFAREKDFIIYLQPGGPETVTPLDEPADLRYRLPGFDLELRFEPGDFTQVNSDINRQMVARAVEMLDPRQDERVLDLFCGIGNFTLPLATRAGEVVGVEGAAELVARARENARRNGLENVRFHVANLYEELQEPWLKERFHKVLLDPPRSGAQEVLGHLPRMGVERILYVSCYPGTLARDAGELVHRHGYRLLSAGVMDMFPHTAHVESIALFEKGGK